MADTPPRPPEETPSRRNQEPGSRIMDAARAALTGLARPTGEIYEADAPDLRAGAGQSSEKEERAAGGDDVRPVTGSRFKDRPRGIGRG